MDNRGNILMQRYELGRLLGQGTFGKVYYARSVQTGQSVAIKVIDKDKITRVGIINQIKREISIMRLVRHPNIVYLHEVMATKTKIYFVMEYAKGGELFDKLSRGKLKEDVARKYFRQLINAVDFCHSRGVYHRDLKPENLLLDENENLKVSDFGLSALAESRRADGLLHTTCGTPAYVAPEVLDRKGYNGTMSDVWSCGVILFVMLAGYLPFHDTNLMELYRKIGKGEVKFPRWFSPEARRLISRILDPNPNTRITIARIRTSTWFRRGLSVNDFSENNGTSNIGSESQEVPRISNLNAFDIISQSNGFRLSRLFEESCRSKEMRYVSWRPVNVIISKLEEIARRMKLRLNKKDGGLFRFEGLKEGRKGVLSVDAEIFSLAHGLHMVEVRKNSGDTSEYEKMLDEGIRPGLAEIVWHSQDGPRAQQEELPEQVRDQVT
ncbi:CBL-interacting serine/threonine-protein kinase 10 [Striga hermonthica]|uniref:non-specific serine/threonine protein kinase n=1 Tax=Striga hermonthica TaxID=68872 RepID=A0A9N7NNH0_STRHE|nr:CBL-interacting serine/threonine-protein kinase 10 [Striga hermonthica]